MTIRIAMWSGPRNISTAMMRAWENRPDTAVIDEPFYACYLHHAGVDHPMREAVIASQPVDWDTVMQQLLDTSVDADIFYQKHMTHHMLEGVDLEFTRNMLHCFLIRDPRLVVQSYARKRETVSSDDIGLKRQLQLYREISSISGQKIPVIDATAVLKDPRAALESLCRRFDIPFYEKMLHWPAGKRRTDGIWASHWYQAVEQSTGWQPWSDPVVQLTPAQEQVAEENTGYYNTLLQLAGDNPTGIQ